MHRSKRFSTWPLFQRLAPQVAPLAPRERALLWLVQLKDGLVSGRETPVGVLPTPEELRLDGLVLRAGLTWRQVVVLHWRR